MYIEGLNCLSLYIRIKTKTVLESLKDFLQTYSPLYPISFSFSTDVKF